MATENLPESWHLNPIVHEQQTWQCIHCWHHGCCGNSWKADNENSLESVSVLPRTLSSSPWIKFFVFTNCCMDSLKPENLPKNLPQPGHYTTFWYDRYQYLARARIQLVTELRRCGTCKYVSKILFCQLNVITIIVFIDEAHGPSPVQTVKLLWRYNILV